MKNKIIIVLILLIVLLSGVVYYYKNKLINNKINTTQINKEVNDFILPENKFNTTMKIPKANIEFSYPSNGFYGLGVELPRKNSIEEEQGLTGLSTLVEDGTVGGVGYNLEKYKFDTNKLSEYLNLSLVYKNKDYIGIGKDLKETVELIASTFSQDNIRNGEYKTINNHVFYIYKQGSVYEEKEVSEDTWDNINVWQAIAMVKDGYLAISLVYRGPGNTPESVAAYKNNDKLFLEILEHIKFE